MKRLSKVKIEWSPSFSYAIGLIVTDGNLSPDKRHMNLTSKDEELIITFKKCLNLENKVGRKGRGGTKEKKYFVVQFGDRNFYDFLLSLGITAAKSKTLGILKIPKKYFSDFLRGCIDGDGNIDVFSHPESKHPQLRIRLFSASITFLEWVKNEISLLVSVQGGWIENSINKGVFILSYGKADSVELFHFIYYQGVTCYLKRKYIVAEPFL